VFLAFSSERIDPGNRRWGLGQIPKVVGGVDEASLELGRMLYAELVPEVVTVSSTRAAEMAKLVENVFREVNIALANEVAQCCEVLGLDAWEVIDAAATKPFGFMPFYPGPGRGGHCIPSDPVFLDWKLRECGFRPRLIEAARAVNEGMPGYVARRVALLLEERGAAVEGARVLLLGVSYKRNVADTRDSPALALIAELESMGARVSYHDPYVSSLRFNGTQMSCRDLEAGLAEADCVVVVADHSAYDWDGVAARAPCVLDCRGALRGKELPHVARL
jgi:UDP-N-acetyl-D-glucosamine dehydrogenase